MLINSCKIQTENSVKLSFHDGNSLAKYFGFARYIAFDL